MKRRILLALLGVLLLYGLVDLFLPDSSPDNTSSKLSASDNSALPDSVLVSAGAQYQRGSIGRFFLGEHYRDVWAVPVKARVFKMSEAEGGLSIEKLGGGMQTASLTLYDSSGRRFALRSLDKDPISVLPSLLRKTFIGSFVRDQVSATSPYAPLVVASLAKAVSVLHPTPRLVYVLPSDQSFKQYSNLFGNKLFMMEEKFTSKTSLTKAFGNATDLMDTEEVLRRQYQSKRHRIDQWAFARARLLDLLLSDWDRHEGQWDWAEYRQRNETWYKPVPKDRDQALCKYDDGVLPRLATRRFAARKFESFHPQYKDVYGLTINASFLDARALSEVSLVDFRRIAREMQLALSDAVLRKAVKQFHAPVYELIGQETFQTLKSRVKLLPQAAEEYYKIIAKEVAIVGSDEKERFVVQRLSHGRTVVEVYQVEGNKLKDKIYSRTFFASETEKINLYGLGADDLFEINGQAAEGSYVHIVGGPGIDEVVDQSVVEGWRKKTVVDDKPKGVILTDGPETDSNLSQEAAENNAFVRFRIR